MPLLGRKPFALVKPPDDLKPNEHVFQVRFTKEVFRDYEEYLKQMNLYRQRVWTCRVTGKTNLTYEKALVSELKAAQRVSFPKEFMGPVLQIVQFSIQNFSCTGELGIEELVDHIYQMFKEQFVVGEEISGWHRESFFRCRILKVIFQDDGTDTKRYQYEVGWLDDDNQTIELSVEYPENLVRRRHPFSKAVLKAFIEESAFGELKWDMPWLVRDKLARRFKIPVGIPLKKSCSHSRKVPMCCKESSNGQDFTDDSMPAQRHKTWKNCKRRSQSVRLEKPTIFAKGELLRGYPKQETMPICFPTDDNLVQPSINDLPFTERPLPSSDFQLPMECIGNLLMVWDFCSSFAKNLQLSPFSLDDFERALKHRESEATLLAETNYALLRAALEDICLRARLLQKRKRKNQVSLDTWKETLCDLLESEDSERFSASIKSVRQDGYGKLEPSLKLEIMHELVDWALRSQRIRSQIDESIEELQAFSSKMRVTPVNRKWEPLSCAKQRQMQQPNVALTSMFVDCKNSSKEAVIICEDTSEKGNHLDENALVGWSRKGKRKSNGSHSCTEELGVNRMDNGTSHEASKSRRTSFRQKIAAMIVDGVEQVTRKEEHTDVQGKGPVQMEVLKVKPSKKQEMAASQKRKEQLDYEMEKCFIRTSPLGRDQNLNRYWFFRREGRVFVESEDSSKWGFYSRREEIEALCKSLNPNGLREKYLQKQLEKHRVRISNSLQKRSREVLQQIVVEEASLRRSLRVRTAPKPTGFLAYVNKYRNSH